MAAANCHAATQDVFRPDSVLRVPEPSVPRPLTEILRAYMRPRS